MCSGIDNAAASNPATLLGVRDTVVNASSTAASAKGEDLPQYIDFLVTLQQWVEAKVPPPDAMLETLKEPKAPYTVLASRPLCRYPKYPRYNGSGDPKVAGSYTCALPATAITATR